MKEKTAHITNHELDELRQMIEAHSGILFDASRERFFSTRVREYLAEKNVHAADLIRLLRVHAREYEALVERLLTQETSFFRYPAVFEALRNRVLTEVQERKFWSNPRSLRIWSAGCSTGEEPYSIAITVADALAFSEAWQVEILATDISGRALKEAQTGIYSQRSLRELSQQQIDTYFERGRQGLALKPRIRRMVSFNQVNLVQPVYIGKLDCIFCMNVLMYFSEERRNSLIQRFFDYLEPGGYLLLGHSESLSQVPVQFQSLTVGDCRMYQKPVMEAVRRTPALVGSKP